MENSVLNGKRILAVDDELDVLEVLEELLPMCDVVPATRAEKAAELIKTEHFDIAILDIMGVDGYKLLRSAKNRGIITVMLTAHAMTPEDTVKSFKQGADSFVPKEKIHEITQFLADIFEAKIQGKSVWWRWLERLGSYYERKFGKQWQNRDRDFWDKFRNYGI